MVRRVFKKRFKGMNWKSGYVYSFKYKNYENDPEPLIILLYSLEGVNPNTNHRWNLFQGINLTYVDRSKRQALARDWMGLFKKTKGNVRFTWELVQKRYPFLELAVRRYIHQPGTLINNSKEISEKNMEKAIKSSMIKDFSKKVKMALIHKFRKFRRPKKKK